jgi:TolA-binding protein
MTGRRILTIAVALPLFGLTACGSHHAATQPTVQADPALLQSRMTEMQAELEQMRQQQELMKQQQQQQQEQQLLQLQQLRQQQQAAGAVPGASAAPDNTAQASPPPPPASPPRDYLPAFNWYDPSEPQEKPDKRGNDQKL